MRKDFKTGWISFCLYLVIPGLLFTGMIRAQNTGSGTVIQGLALKRPYSRPSSPLDLDRVEYQLALDTWKPPAAGDSVIFSPDFVSVWTGIHADTLGWFSGPVFRRAWVSLSFESYRPGTVLVESFGPDLFFANGKPRTGNRYAHKGFQDPREPGLSFSVLPVKAHTGTNHLLFLCTRGRLRVRVLYPEKSVMLNISDMTLPDLIQGESVSSWGSAVVINADSVSRDDLIM